MNAAAALLLLAPLAWAEPRVEIVERRVIEPGAFEPSVPAAPLVLPLALVVERGSPWAKDGELERTLGKASAILSRCGVTLGRAQVLVAAWTDEAKRRLNESNPYKGPAEMAVLDDPQLPSGRPVAFLFGPGSVPPTAKAYNRTSVDAFARQFPEARRLLGTTWITTDWRHGGARSIAPGFSILAHELAHLLGDMGHVPDAPNLMTDSEEPGMKTGDLSDAQCEAIRRLDGRAP